MTNPPAEHQASAAAAVPPGAIGCAIVTVSDTRTRADDRSGDALERAVTSAGHRVAERSIVPDDPRRVTELLDRLVGDAAVQVVLLTGGTGVGRRDCTVEVVRAAIDIELEGFGELMRMLSHQEIGAAAMMSRATAGLARREAVDGGDTFIFAMPGSTGAVELAMRELIVPQMPHLVWLRRQG